MSADTAVDRRRGRGVERERVTVRLAVDDKEAIEELVEDGRFPNRSEAIRAAVADLREQEGV